MFAPLFEVPMWKKCTPLWREAHVEVNMYKAPHVRGTFGGSDIVSRGRRKGLCTLSRISKTRGLEREREGEREREMDRWMDRWMDR